MIQKIIDQIKLNTITISFPKSNGPTKTVATNNPKNTCEQEIATFDQYVSSFAEDLRKE